MRTSKSTWIIEQNSILQREAAREFLNTFSHISICFRFLFFLGKLNILQQSMVFYLITYHITNMWNNNNNRTPNEHYLKGGIQRRLAKNIFEAFEWTVTNPEKPRFLKLVLTKWVLVNIWVKKYLMISSNVPVIGYKTINKDINLLFICCRS